MQLPGNIGGNINNPTPYNNLGDLLSGLFSVGFYIASFLMFFWLVWGAFEYLFAGGEKEKLGKAQKRITWAIIGFLFVALAFTFREFLQSLFPQSLPGGITPITTPPNTP